MKRSEFQALVKRAEAKARRKTEIKRLIKSAALANSRKDALKYGIKAACGALEKDASWASRLVGKGINRAARAGRAAGAAPSFGERLGSQLHDTGFRKTIGSGVKRYWGNLTGANERRFLSPFNNGDDLVRSGRESLKSVEEAVRKSGGKFNAEGLAKNDAAIAKNVRNNAKAFNAERAAARDSGMFDADTLNEYMKATGDFGIPKDQYGALARQAARMRSATNRARLGTAVAAPVALGGAAAMFGGGSPQEGSYASRYTPIYGGYGMYPQYGWG